MGAILHFPRGLPDAPKDTVSDETPGGVIGQDTLPEHLNAGPGPDPLPPKLAELDLISGIVGDPTTNNRIKIGEFIPIALTSTEWAKVAAEVRTMPKIPGKPTPENFRRLNMRSVQFYNAGTADGETVNIINKPIAAYVDFANRRERLKSGRG